MRHAGPELSTRRDNTAKGEDGHGRPQSSRRSIWDCPRGCGTADVIDSLCVRRFALRQGGVGCAGRRRPHGPVESNERVRLPAVKSPCVGSDLPVYLGALRVVARLPVGGVMPISRTLPPGRLVERRRSVFREASTSGPCRDNACRTVAARPVPGPHEQPYCRGDRQAPCASRVVSNRSGRIPPSEV